MRLRSTVAAITSGGVSASGAEVQGRAGVVDDAGEPAVLGAPREEVVAPRRVGEVGPDDACTGRRRPRPRAGPPRRRGRRWRSRARGRDRRAASRSAVAAPMPRVPPVTRVSGRHTVSQDKKRETNKIQKIHMRSWLELEVGEVEARRPGSHGAVSAGTVRCHARRAPVGDLPAASRAEPRPSLDRGRRVRRLQGHRAVVRQPELVGGDPVPGRDSPAGSGSRSGRGRTRPSGTSRASGRPGLAVQPPSGAAPDRVGQRELEGHGHLATRRGRGDDRDHPAGGTVARALRLPGRPRRQPAAPAGPAARRASEHAAGPHRRRRSCARPRTRRSATWCAMQARVGLRAATDGEFRRTSWHMDFIYRLGGISRTDERIRVHVPQRGRRHRVHPAGLRGRRPGPAGRADLRRRLRVPGDDGRRRRDAEAHHPVAEHGPLPGRRGRDRPGGLPGRRPVLGRPVRRLRRRRSARVADLGCTYLQLDDTCLAYLNDPAQRAELAARGDDAEHQHLRYIRQINAALADRPPGCAVTTHMCRGNFRSLVGGRGGYDFVAEALFSELEVDGFFLEYDDERSGDPASPCATSRRASSSSSGLVTASARRERVVQVHAARSACDEAGKHTGHDDVGLRVPGLLVLDRLRSAYRRHRRPETSAEPTRSSSRPSSPRAASSRTAPDGGAEVRLGSS